VDISTSWCGYCEELSAFLTRQPSIFEGYGWDEMVDLVEDGTIQWVTIMSENYLGGPPDHSTVAAWDAEYPHEKIPVLADDGQVMPSHLNIYGYPTVVLMDENMEIVFYDREAYYDAFDAVIDLAGSR